MSDLFTTSTVYTTEMDKQIMERLTVSKGLAELSFGLRSMVMFQCFIRDVKSKTNVPFEEWDLDYTIERLKLDGARL